MCWSKSLGKHTASWDYPRAGRLGNDFMGLTAFGTQWQPTKVQYVLTLICKSRIVSITKTRALLQTTFLNPYCRLSLVTTKTVGSYTEYTDHQCVNTWSTLFTSSNNCLKNTWWTVYWKTSPYCRYDNQNRALTEFCVKRAERIKIESS